MKVFLTLALLLLAGLSPLAAQSSEQLDFLIGLSDGRDLRNMVHEYLERKADALLAGRRQRIAQFKGPADVAARKEYLREHMMKDLGGPFPERTPLNPRVVGVLERDDYKIEKIIFESQPGFYVTANLYLPKRGQPPYPGILFPLGHEAGAKANPTWQQILSSFAKKGFVALAWEPIGQGERIQLYDRDFENSKLVRSTTEHTVVGIECLLVGDSVARYTIWDGIRALDYLVSRKEVDPKRIGCTGNSGGGTHTAYISALDDRIQVAAPSCFLTSWARLIATIGPQDAEQCLPPWIADGLDHPDFIYAFAPKPYLMLSAIRDFFPILGARSTFHEAQRVYSLLGAAEKLNMVEADDGHGYSKPRRMASYRWFSHWLKGTDDEQPEPEVTIATPEELQCTKTGQVTTSLGGETVYSLNQKRLEELRKNGRFSSLDEVRRMVEFQKRQEPLKVEPFGQIARNGYHIEKLVYESEPGIGVPSLLYVPQSPAGKKPAAIFVSGRGKAAADEEVQQLVNAGMVVLSIDARDFGETRRFSDEDRGWSSYFGDYETAMTALLTGKPLVAMRAEDISRGVDLLVNRVEVDPNKVSAIGWGTGAVPVLYAAAFDSRIRKVGLERMLLSYESVVTHHIHRDVFENVVIGALRHYDLPDLIGWIGPRPVSVVDAVDPMGELVELTEVKKQYSRPGSQVQILRRKPADTAATLYRDML